MFLKWLDINILEGDSIKDYDKLRKEYYAYLDSVKNLIGLNVYNYAAADWHYDASIHYSPHDAVLKNIIISEGKNSRLNLDISYFGAYHDYILEFSYKNIESCLVNFKSNKDRFFENLKNINGEFLWDSIEWDFDTKNIKHHIVFSDNTNIIIECEDFKYSYFKR